MSYDDYLKQNPEFAMRQARISAGNYHCPNCGHDFDKPASQSYGWGAFFCGLILSIIGVVIGMTGIGMIIAIPNLTLSSCAFIAFAVSYGTTAVSPQKICPYCNWKYIVRIK